MTYHTPIKQGDRVALAPHLDLWMAGIRFGNVEQILVNEENERMYRVVCNHNTSFWTDITGLLGAVRQPVVDVLDAVEQGATLYMDEFEGEPLDEQGNLVGNKYRRL
jgi:hypothetical protein